MVVFAILMPKRPVVLLYVIGQLAEREVSPIFVPRIPERDRISPVAVARFVKRVAIFPVAVARLVWILRIDPERAFCARESLK